MTSSFDDYLANIIATAPVAELVMLAEAREALIAKDDNYGVDDDNKENA